MRRPRDPSFPKEVLSELGHASTLLVSIGSLRPPARVLRTRARRPAGPRSLVAPGPGPAWPPPVSARAQPQETAGSIGLLISPDPMKGR